MNRKRLKVLSVLLIVLTFGTFAQRATQLKINEVMIKNTDNYHDDYGAKSPWIEIFNTAYATVDIGGCYLSNDPTNLTKYLIPKGDLRTKIKARQHTIFWADKLPSRGIFHLNFGLDTTHVNTLLLVNANGTEIIDSISIHWNKNSGTSFGRCTDGVNQIKNSKTGKFESAWRTLHIITPGTNNLILTGKEYQQSLINKFPDGIGNTVTSSTAVNEKYKKSDAFGGGMSFIAMGVVFLALILLFIMFSALGKISINRKRIHLMRTLGIKNRDTADKLAKNTGEIYAAIAMALYELDNEEHDWEETKLTINKVARTYSPWSSKIYGLRETPNKK